MSWKDVINPNFSELLSEALERQDERKRREELCGRFGTELYDAVEAIVNDVLRRRESDERKTCPMCPDCPDNCPLEE